MKQEPLKKLHVLIVEARFYEKHADNLLEGAKAALKKAGASYDLVTVPGALEIPAAIAFAARGARHYDGYIALGCVIRGQTYHFDIVANESCRGLTDLSVRDGLAIGNGILTVENAVQADERASVTKKDKGGFAARAALDMIVIKKNFGDIRG